MENNTNENDITTEPDDAETDTDLMVDTNRWEEEADPPLEDEPPPPIAAPVYNVTRQLVRDPYARLGGVASGIAHRLGWDTSLIRLAFVVLTFMSAGFFILIYLLAWMIIPRAEYWPPSTTGEPRERISQRDLGIGLAAIGILLAIAWGAGSFGAVLLPLLMIGGGVLLLTQNPRPVESFSAPVSEPETQPADVDGGDGGTPPPLDNRSPLGQPVPPRPKSRRRGLKIFGALFAVFLLLLVIVPLVVVLSVTGGDLDFDNSGTIERTPLDVDSIPATLSADGAEIILDLRELEPEMFDDLQTPVDVAIDVDFGRIEVIVPSDVAVMGEADADFGAIKVFGEEQDGLSTDLDFGTDDALIDLELDMNFGEIVVRRG
ncbi:MAG: PspC domain-containing protein [Acidimicrobiales bacterium]|nr:PspC domain-containing protein [Acidimicrobiales bacterium]